jgi:thymidylate synthase (FAD)
MATAKLIVVSKFADGVLDEIAQQEANFALSDEVPGSELERLTVYIARVSNPDNQSNPNISGLLNTCIRDGHVSVFEHGYMTIEVKTTIDISRQILRHRSFTFQEFSTRYASVTRKGRVPFRVPKYRRQDKKNRQNSFNDLDEQLQQQFQERTQAIFNEIENLYNEMLESGVAKETARRILPLCTDTTIYMTGNLRSWIFWLKSRLDASTQLEHREVALACQEIFIRECPLVSKALGWVE